MLQADGWQGAPIPLMKKWPVHDSGTRLGDVGKGWIRSKPLETQRVEVAKEHEATQMLDNLSEEEKAELEESIRQNEGLALEAGETPGSEPVPNRKKGFAPPVERPTPEMEEDRHRRRRL